MIDKLSIRSSNLAPCLRRAFSFVWRTSLCRKIADRPEGEGSARAAVSSIEAMDLLAVIEAMWDSAWPHAVLASSSAAVLFLTAT